MKEIRAAVLTVSDGAHHGTRVDKSGPALVERLREKHRLPRRAHDALHEVESPAQMQLSFC